MRPGERPDAFDTVTLIVEAKGCWNGGLDTAMAAQLRDRSMKDNRCRHGLYLVGWFVCHSGTPTDPRRAAVPRITLQEARDRFKGQAADLSHEGMLIRAFVANTALR